MTELPPTVNPAPPHHLESVAGPSIAYHRTGAKSPGVVFMGGFMSDMSGAKAMALEAWAKGRGQAFLRFDYRGHGASAGRFEDGTIGLWAEDAGAAFDALTDGPQILVGSSMGGWIALLTALRRPERVMGFVGIAPALDFTEDLVWARLPPAAREALLRDGVYYQPSQYGEKPYPITHRLIEEARQHFLMQGPIPFERPVRILHGMQDPDVPWRRSLTLAERLVARDVRIVLIKDGDHRLSRPDDLALLCRTVEGLCQTAHAATRAT
jgi:pimeloyl-ACP methyl ester carboxylesterase